MNSNPPSGTVTFLFTDIEGSAKLAREYPKTWEALRARHHAILRTAIETNNGYVFQIIGDAFCAAFHNGGDAINAAVKSQQDLQAEDWGEAPIRVRMGIHTGKADLEESGQYVGYMTLSRVQRLMSAGHGGQAMISLATQELVRDELPDGVGLRDLGKHILKDLIRPEHIYQIVAANLPLDFPPLKTLEAYRHNLPAQMTSFIGREKEMAEVKQALGEHRLVTLTGSGGTGKTRLCLQVAADSVDQFPDGVWFVELALLTDPDLIPQTILSCLGLREQKGRTSLQLLIDYLHEKNLLLVLDNCEHLIEACAQLVEPLLNHAHRIKIMATGREALGVKGELIWHVPSLSLPDAKHIPAVEGLSQYEAVQLFLERAELVQPHFTLTKDNASDIAQICFRLDGIPLALELAAARVKGLSVEQIASRLDDRFRLLTAGSRTALPRQRTLLAAIDWSYKLLSEEEHMLLHRLSVFAGGWTLEAAEFVCEEEGLESREILDLLLRLVDKSLVVADTQGTKPRYHLLETIRQYASEKLVESGEINDTKDRHLGYFIQWAEKAEPYLAGMDQLIWLDHYEAEHDNLRAALGWSRSDQNKAEANLRLAAACGRFWRLHGYLSEGRARLIAALSQIEVQKRTLVRARALTYAANLEYLQSDFPAMRPLAEEALSIWRELGQEGRAGIAYTLDLLGELATEEGDYTSAPVFFQEAIGIYRELNDLKGVSDILMQFGWAAMRTGDYPQAERHLEEFLTLASEAADKTSLTYAFSGMGEVALRQGQYQRANSLLDQGLELSRARGDKWGTGTLLGSLGWVALCQDDFKRMRELLRESLSVRMEIGDRGGIAWCLEKLAQSAVLEGGLQKAVKVFGGAAALRVPIGSVIDPADQPEYERIVAELQTALSQVVFAAAWTEGKVMPLEKIINYALSEPDAPVKEPSHTEKEK